MAIGPEVQDFELMDFPGEVLDVVITNKTVAGKTLKEIAESEIGRVHGREVYLRSLLRAGHEMPFTDGTTIDRGDVLRIVGAKRNAERVATELGYADRPTNATDMVFVGKPRPRSVSSRASHRAGCPRSATQSPTPSVPSC